MANETQQSITKLLGSLERIGATIREHDKKMGEAALNGYAQSLLGCHDAVFGCSPAQCKKCTSKTNIVTGRPTA